MGNVSTQSMNIFALINLSELFYFRFVVIWEIRKRFFLLLRGFESAKKNTIHDFFLTFVLFLANFVVETKSIKKQIGLIETFAGTPNVVKRLMGIFY